MGDCPKCHLYYRRQKWFDIHVALCKVKVGRKSMKLYRKGDEYK